MLDVITDFWKPVKKPAAAETLDLQSLHIGSGITFGTVPQTLLSGARFKVSGINTYQFGEERMTSFALTGGTDDHVSLIIANADGDQYLAISRRIALADRMRLFDPAELEAITEQADATKLSCREIDANWRAWLVSSYKKEISGLRGAVIRGDFRNAALPANVSPQPFDYLLLTSDSNEYAIEIERYMDGRLEVYATVYRRVSDIVELDDPSVASPAPASKPVAPMLEVVKSEAPSVPEPEQKKPAKVAKSAKQEEPVTPLAEALEAAAPSFPAFFPPEPTPPVQPIQPIQETPMQPGSQTITNGSSNENQPMKAAFAAPAPANRQEIKAVTQAIEQENDAIECDLRAANKIIEEAIRNEMRLSDVVRRIIALPVANPESVQIPMVLAEADFQLLAIRYGVPASDRDAIKSRIIEEINDFSGSKK
jgi:hypothetical protein